MIAAPCEVLPMVIHNARFDFDEKTHGFSAIISEGMLKYGEIFQGRGIPTCCFSVLRAERMMYFISRLWP